MLSLINRVLDWFRSLFWKEEMELTLVGLQNSGKTTFVNVIAVCLLHLSLLLCTVLTLQKVSQAMIAIEIYFVWYAVYRKYVYVYVVWGCLKFFDWLMLEVYVSI